VTGSVNFEYAFYSSYNTTNGELMQFFVPGNNYSIGITSYSFYAINSTSFVSIISRDYFQPWVVFMYDMQNRRMIWQY